MKKVRIILIALLVLLLCLIPFLIKGENNSSNYELIEASFEYVPAMENKSVRGTYYYTDDYFTSSGKKQNEHLRTMAMNIVLATSPALDKNSLTENITNLLTAIKYNDIEIFDYDIKTSNSIGTVIAHKNIDDYETIIVSLRGDKYENEWSSNFDSGETGNIKGFEDASIKVINRLKEYISKNINKKTKILVTGYSRSGAVSNLVGVYLNEHKEEFKLESNDDIFVYTFEAPNSSNSNKIYQNIHNVVNKNDLVTYVYPQDWGINNNGIVEEIQKEDLIIEIYKFSLESIITGDDLIKRVEASNDTYKIKTKNFLEDFVKWLATKESDLKNKYTNSRETFENKTYNGIDRKLYMNTLGKYMPQIIDNSYDKNFSEEKILNFLQKDFIEAATNNKFDFYSTLISFVGQTSFSSKQVDNIKTKINDWLKDANKNNKLTTKEYNYLKEILTDDNNIILLQGLLSTSINEKPSAYHLATLIANLDVLVKQHYTQYNYELIKAQDSYYK